MNTQNLTSNLTLKNYKDLCTTLDIKPMTSTDSRKAQFKELERYCTYTKQGQKIIINEVFNEPLDKIDGRQEGNHSKYVESVKYLILNKLSECEGYKYTLTKDKLFALLGMVNQQYLQKEIAKKILLKKDERFNKYDINHFYLRVNNKLTRILFDSLNSLKRRYLIDHREINTIVTLDINNNEIHKEASVEEIAIINSAKYQALSDMNLNSIMQVMFKFKSDEFYNRVNLILNKQGIEYTYKVIELIFMKKDVLNELSLIERKKHRIDLNNKVIDTININAKNTYDKNMKEYNEGLEDFLLNDKPMFGKYSEINFKGFRHKSDYVDIQLELSEYLLRIED